MTKKVNPHVTGVKKQEEGGAGVAARGLHAILGDERTQPAAVGALGGPSAPERLRELGVYEQERCVYAWPRPVGRGGRWWAGEDSGLREGKC